MGDFHGALDDNMLAFTKAIQLVESVLFGYTFNFTRLACTLICKMCVSCVKMASSDHAKVFRA